MARNPTKRLAILKAAEKIFSRKGFHEATITEIAKMAKASEATIYDYFSTKEELLFAIPAEGSGQLYQGNLELLRYIHGAGNKLRCLIYRMLELYQKRPDYANVSVLILKVNRNFVKTESYKVIQKSASLMIDVIKEGMASGEFKSDINPFLARSMIWGIIEHLTIRRGVLDKNYDLLAIAEDIVKLVFSGIMSPSEDKTIKLDVNLMFSRGDQKPEAKG